MKTSNNSHFQNILQIIKSNNSSDSEKIDSLLQELDIYNAELIAQNEELLEKEKLLLDSKLKYEQLFFNAPIPYLIVNEKLIIEQFNTEASLILQLYDNIRYNFLTFFSSKDFNDFFLWFNYNEGTIELDLKIKQKLKRFKLFKRVHPVDETYFFISLIEVQREYELTKNLEKQVKDKTSQFLQQNILLQQQSKMAAMGEMIVNIAHQWRQPLNALSGNNIDLYLKYQNNTINNKTVEQFFKKSERLIEKMDTTIENFMQFSDPKREKNNFFIDKILDDIQKIYLKQKISNLDVHIELDIEKEITFYGYKNDLEEIFLVILTNSLDAFESKNIQKPNIKIRIKRINHKINIQIEDNAEGINDSYIEKVFELYFTTKNKITSNGIGLYMVKTLIEKSFNGTISLENKNKGLLTQIFI